MNGCGRCATPSTLPSTADDPRESRRTPPGCAGGEPRPVLGDVAVVEICSYRNTTRSPVTGPPSGSASSGVVEARLAVAVVDETIRRYESPGVEPASPTLSTPPAKPTSNRRSATSTAASTSTRRAWSSPTRSGRSSPGSPKERKALEQQLRRSVPGGELTTVRVEALPRGTAVRVGGGTSAIIPRHAIGGWLALATAAEWFDPDRLARRPR